MSLRVKGRDKKDCPGAKELCLSNRGEAFSEQKSTKQTGTRDIPVIRAEAMFFARTGYHINSTIIVDFSYPPEFIHHIMVLFPPLKRVYLPRPGPGAERTLRLVVDDWITNPEMHHLNLLSGFMTGS